MTKKSEPKVDPTELERKELLQQVEGGDEKAVIKLVAHYLDYDSPEDCVKPVLKLLEESASRGSPLAAYELWRLYDSGDYYPVQALKEFVKADLAKANLWKGRSVALGHPRAVLEKAKDFVEVADYEKALLTLDTLDELPTEMFEDESEMLTDVHGEAEDLHETIQEKLEWAVKTKEILKNIDSATAEDIYNLAKRIIGDSGAEVPPDAIVLLKLASEKGLVLAKKLLQRLGK